MARERAHEVDTAITINLPLASRSDLFFWIWFIMKRVAGRPLYQPDQPGLWWSLGQARDSLHWQFEVV